MTDCGVTHLGRRPAAREEVPIVVAMKWDVEHAGVAVEHFLGAVAVVNILGWGKIMTVGENNPHLDGRHFVPRCRTKRHENSFVSSSHLSGGHIRIITVICGFAFFYHHVCVVVCVDCNVCRDECFTFHCKPNLPKGQIKYPNLIIYILHISVPQRDTFTMEYIDVVTCEHVIVFNQYKQQRRALLPSRQSGSCWRWACVGASWRLWPQNWSNRNPW